MFQAARRFAVEHEWVQDAAGILGNLCFLIGSILLLRDSMKTWGIWLFVAGAAGMTIAACASALVRWNTRLAKPHPASRS